MNDFPRIMVCAPASGSGKSVIATGLMAAFSKQMKVQAFKAGPDYIDPMYHTLASGRPCRNLDTWMLSAQQVQTLFKHAAMGVGLSVIEGVMGLFDGVGSDPFSGSSAELAGLLQCPVLLVLDCSKMSGSTAAVVHGFHTFNPSLPLAGVICNRVGSEVHGQWLKEAIEKYNSIPVLGCIPRLTALQVPERHLGLFTVAEEPASAGKFIEQAAEAAAQYLDLESILALAHNAPPMAALAETTMQGSEPEIRLAVARDEAFCFYYEDNLDILRQNGAQIVPFSPLKDDRLPEGICGIYLGGGYPELYAGQLSQNGEMRRAIKTNSQKGMPVYAECGGLIYLTEGIRDGQGCYPLAGVLPGWCEMGEKLKMGYRDVEVLRPNLLAAAGTRLKGHEFHYSSWQAGGPAKPAYRVFRRNDPSTTGVDGYAGGNILASYIHLHFVQDAGLAQNFIKNCRLWKEKYLRGWSTDS